MDPTSNKELNENFNNVAPICFFYEGNEYKSTDQVTKILRNFYLPFDHIDIRSFESLSDLCSDGLIGYGVHRFVHFVSQFTATYYYKFSYVGRIHNFHSSRNMPYGVDHGDDLKYVFLYNPRIELTDPKNVIVQRMTRIWEQFAKTG